MDRIDRKLLKRNSDGKVECRPAKRIKKSESAEDDLNVQNNPILIIPYTWKIEEVIADELHVAKYVVNDVIELLDQENTIPFIARYRKEKTRNMEVKKLYELKESYENLTVVKKKIQKLGQTIKTAGKLTSDVINTLSNIKTLDEYVELAAPFKPADKRSLAERARQLGLEYSALKILESKHCDLQTCIKPGTKGLSNLTDVNVGIQRIIADVISKDLVLVQQINDYLQQSDVRIESNKSKAATKKEIDETSETFNRAVHHINPNLKFENYYKFNMPVRLIKPHQVLAINRAEQAKILTVKVIIPTTVYNRFTSFCENKWVRSQINPDHRKLLETSYNDAWSRLLEPQFCRKIRSQLTKTAEKASIDVFVSNLRQLLLTPPVRGKVVAGIDPGFTHGCKVAVISPTQDILHTTVFYLPYKGKSCSNDKKIRDIMLEYRCTIIGIGNGTASRETESLISKMISRGAFQPLDVKYCIVNESGASTYSITAEAAEEMPNLDENIRSAVSIARRLSDPLAEYVKIQPQHLGVGMYQHDIGGNKLSNALDDVVTECVSFVGVDLNTGSETLLRKVAGLNKTTAKNIVEWRSLNGPFQNREQLKSVKGVGPKSYEQCAGFIRILVHDENKSKPSEKETKQEVKRKKSAVNTSRNYLDMTCIHPESYNIATSFLEYIDEPLENIGHSQLINKVKKFSDCSALQKLADELKCGLPTLQLIYDGLSHPLDYDLRSEFQTPLFRKGLSSFSDLKAGTILTGRVTNVVHFGAFVDVGVGHDGLIHISNMKRTTLHIGDRIEVIVQNIDCERKRLGLMLSRLL
uniref:S1 motif domain-containing protein n=1 Tax=Strigamia maritima TaxID=126957 RepID=T1JNU4_STRMM